MLTICLKDNTPIGFIGFKKVDNKAELSYLFDYDYCNKGYCTEACKRLLEYGFDELGLDEIYADTIKDNNSSKRVLEKLGFEQVGEREEFYDYSLSKEKYYEK